MHTLPSSLSALLLLSSCLAAAPGSFKLWGQVRHGEQGVADALVVAGSDSSRADASGNYSLPQVKAGPCALRLSAPGYEDARDFVYLRKEAFLPLALQKPRLLVERFSPTLKTMDLSLPVGAVDVDGDGQVDLLGWLPLTQGQVEVSNSLPALDPWRDPWWEIGPGLPLPSTTSIAAPFFAVRGAPGAWTRVTDQALVPQARLGISTSGARSADLRLGRELGSWHRLDLRLGGRQHADAALLTGAEAQAGLVEISHRWLAAPHLSWHQLVRLNQSEVLDVQSQAPGLWLPLSSAESWEDGTRTQRNLSWQGRAVWTPSSRHRSEALVWTRKRSLRARGMESDRVLDRLPSAAAPSGDRHTFLTHREDDRDGWGLRFALEQEHDQGLLQAGLELENHQRHSLGRLGEDSLVAPADLSWFALNEEVSHFAATLRDHWRMGEGLRLEAALDLRYFYYDLRRDARVGVPDRAFNSDLLALNPRLSLGGGEGTPWELSAQRRHWMADPAAWWAPGRSPEAARDEALVAVADATGELEGYLPSPQVDQLRFQVSNTPATRANGAQWLLAAWWRQWEGMALPWWTSVGQAWLPSRPVQALQAQEAGLDLQLRLQRGVLFAQVAASLSRAKLEGWLWRPVADTTLWSWSASSQRTLPGTPPAAATLSAGWTDVRVGACRLALEMSGSWTGARPNEWAPGLGEAQAAQWAWSADLRLRPSATSALEWRVWALDRGVGSETQAQPYTWQADLSRGRTVAVPDAPRQFGLALTWSPRHGD